MLKILNVEDDDDDAALVQFALAQMTGHDCRVERIESLGEMPAAMLLQHPDIILLDLHLPDSKNIETVLNARAMAGDVPLLVLTGRNEPEVGIRAIEAGAQDFVPKEELMTPLFARSIDFAIRRKALQKDAEARAQMDMLTGLGNRVAMMARLNAAVSHSQRHGGGFALAFIDLDGFKNVNDTYGHAAGDRLLEEIAARLRKGARTSDNHYRLGGDEFVIFLDGLETHGEALSAVKRYASEIERPIVLGPQWDDIEVTVGASLGIACYPSDGSNPAALLEVADAGMYQAKKLRKRNTKAFSK